IKQFDENAKNFVLPDNELDNPDLFCAVYTGAIKRANNLRLLLDAAVYLKDIENLRILVWGEGNEVETLKQKVSELGLDGRFIFKGFVEKKYIPSIVTRSDLNLMHWERTSVNNYGYDYNKLFDYLAAGKPVFSTIQSGHSLLINNNCGIETNGRTPKDFASGIRIIYRMSQEEKTEWGTRARKAALNYDFNELTKKLESIIEKI
ncbi:MAG: glycosyltransferase, partial [Desulfosporosinus sp.]